MKLSQLDMSLLTKRTMSRDAHRCDDSSQLSCRNATAAGSLSECHEGNEYLMSRTNRTASSACQPSQHLKLTQTLKITSKVTFAVAEETTPTTYPPTTDHAPNPLHCQPGALSKKLQQRLGPGLHPGRDSNLRRGLNSQ